MARLAEITARLRAMERRERTVTVLSGAVKLFLEAVCLTAVWFVLDWLLVLPWYGRLSVGVLVALVLLHGMWIYLAAPVLQRTRLEALALRVEKAHPGLEDRLISALQLSEQDKAGGRAFSPSLIEALVEDCRNAVRPIDFSALVTFRPLKRLAAAGIVATAVALIFAAFNQEHVRVFAARVTGAEIPYPTRTRIVEHTSSGKVIRGQPFTVRLVAEGEIPRKGRLEVHSADGTEPVTLDLEATTKPVEQAGGGRAVFEAELKAVTQDLKCRIFVGDAVSGSIRVAAVDPPQVAGFQVFITYPDYTGKRELALPAGIGDFEALEGSRMRVTGCSTKPLERAWLAVYPRQQEGRIVEMTVSEDVCFAAEYLLTAGGFYEIRLLDTDGFEDQDTLRFRVKVVHDEPPQITIGKPGDGRTWLSDAVWPLEGRVEDDFGVDGVRLIWKVIDGTGGEIALDVGEPEESPSGRLVYRFSRAVENVRFRVQPYDEVLWKLVARDNRPGAPQQIESREFSFSVVDWATKMQELLELRERLTRDISRMSDEESELKRELPAARATGEQEGTEP